MMWLRVCLSMVLGLSAIGSAAADADAEAAAGDMDFEMSPEQMQMLQRFAAIEWVEGPRTADIGGLATIEVPAGHRFTGPAGAQELLNLYGNPRNPNVKGVIEPMAEDENWTLMFTYDPIGYVDDSDRDDLDAGELISAFRAGIPAGNEARRAMGASQMRGMDWAEEPFYDPQTNNLTWALDLEFDEGHTINYDIRLLGRRGVMEVTLLDAPETYAAAVPKAKQILSTYAFNPGSKYGEFVSGDKVAAVGLTGLVAGGAVVAAAKTGLLAKLGLILAKGGKAIILGIVAVFAGLGSFLKKLFGGGDTATEA